MGLELLLWVANLFWLVILLVVTTVGVVRWEGRKRRQAIERERARQLYMATEGAER